MRSNSLVNCCAKNLSNQNLLQIFFLFLATVERNEQPQMRVELSGAEL